MQKNKKVKAQEQNQFKTPENKNLYMDNTYKELKVILG